jgi:hypothetical protein
MCRQTADLDEHESAIASTLRSRVKAQITWRNDLAHGDWFVHLSRLGIVPIGASQVVRIKPMRSDGAIEVIDLAPGDIDQRSDQVAALRDLVTEYGLICFGIRDYAGMRVGDVLVKRSGEIVREGPRAPETFGGL